MADAILAFFIRHSAFYLGFAVTLSLIHFK